MVSMCSTVSFLVVRRVLSLRRLGPRPDEKDIEIAVLRRGARPVKALWGATL
jgi:hypothetical protein